MISEHEALTRAEYMNLVRRQLKVLRDRKIDDARDYEVLLATSSLRLSEIEWVREMVAQGVRQGKAVSVLERLIYYYEGYFEALARVLEAKPDELEATFDPNRIRSVEAEMRRVVDAAERRKT